jgi:hypothetical protein
MTKLKIPFNSVQFQFRLCTAGHLLNQQSNATIHKYTDNAQLPDKGEKSLNKLQNRSKNTNLLTKLIKATIHTKRLAVAVVVVIINVVFFHGFSISPWAQITLDSGWSWAERQGNYSRHEH